MNEISGMTLGSGLAVLVLAIVVSYLRFRHVTTVFGKEWGEVSEQFVILSSDTIDDRPWSVETKDCLKIVSGPEPGSLHRESLPAALEEIHEAIDSKAVRWREISALCVLAGLLITVATLGAELRSVDSNERATTGSRVAADGPGPAAAAGEADDQVGRSTAGIITRAAANVYIVNAGALAIAIFSFAMFVGQRAAAGRVRAIASSKLYSLAPSPEVSDVDPQLVNALNRAGEEFGNRLRDLNTQLFRQIDGLAQEMRGLSEGIKTVVTDVLQDAHREDSEHVAAIRNLATENQRMVTRMDEGFRALVAPLVQQEEQVKKLREVVTSLEKAVSGLEGAQLGEIAKSIRSAAESFSTGIEELSGRLGRELEGIHHGVSEAIKEATTAGLERSLESVAASVAREVSKSTEAQNRVVIAALEDLGGRVERTLGAMKDESSGLPVLVGHVDGLNASMQDIASIVRQLRDGNGESHQNQLIEQVDGLRRSLDNLTRRLGSASSGEIAGAKVGVPPLTAGARTESWWSRFLGRRGRG